MKSKILIVVGIFLVSSVIMGCGSNTQEANEETVIEQVDIMSDQPVVIAGDFKPFSVYTDKGSPSNHFIPSGWMGDNVEGIDIIRNDASTENPHSGKTCIKIVYTSAASTGKRWVGIYWQNPAENWGNKKGGFDLTGAKKLTFWAKGEKGGERIGEFKMGGITGDYPDSDTAGIDSVFLTKEWKKYTIDLGGKDISYISGGFCWSANLDANPNGCTFYMDDIVYE
ncbi:MAG: hypothetical protein ABH954_03680 [Candidatus Omnitrophota bacterium]